MELPTRVATDRYGFELACDLAMNNAFYPTDFWQINARAFDLHSLRILNRLATLLRLEARVFPTFLEEVFVSARQVLQGLLQHLRVRVTQPLKLLLEFRQPDGHRMVVQTLSCRAIEFAGRSKSVVPYPTRTPELNGQIMRLFVSRVEPDAGGVEHDLNIVRLYLKCKGQCYRLTPYIPALKDRALRRSKVTFVLHVAYSTCLVMWRTTKKYHPIQNNSWCALPNSNRHYRQILSLLCLPVPPSAHSWCQWPDSNRHLTGFEAAASAVGLHWRIGVPHRSLTCLADVRTICTARRTGRRDISSVWTVRETATHNSLCTQASGVCNIMVARTIQGG